MLDKDIDLEEQYDKIYRYCYFRLHNREAAEDITQETFLRFYLSDTYCEKGQAVRYLYTIARNLCVDECRRKGKESLTAEFSEVLSEESIEEKTVLAFSIRRALEKLNDEEQELLLLRYGNELPMQSLCDIFQLSRFVLYRKIKKASKNLEAVLREENLI